MPSEGMVDALRRACRFLTPSGVIVDLHPTAMAARLEVASTVIGPIEAGDAPVRHAAASAALTAAAAEGLVRIEGECDFDFYSYGDSPEELAEYIEENWRCARIDPPIVARAREAMRVRPGSQPRVLERVRITVLRPTHVVATSVR
jgi:hypothetical protein